MVVNQAAGGVVALRATDAATLSATFAGLDGAAVDPGATTVTITREGDGTAVATGAAASGTGAAARTYALTGEQTATLDRLTVVWTSAQQSGGSPATITQVYETVGDWLFTVAEARAAHPDLTAPTYGDPAIAAARQRIAEWFEEICGVAFAPRYRRVVASGDGTCELLLPGAMLPTAVRRVEERERGATAWVAFGAEDLADVLAEPWGALVRESRGVWTLGRRNWRIAFEHGHAAVPPPIRRAAIRLLLHQIIPSNLSDRSLSETNSLGTFRLAAPDATRWGRWTGLPEVDSVLAEYHRRAPGLA